MKTFTVLFLLIFTSVKIQAQDYLISFAGSGDTSQVGSVIVDNLTSGATLALNGGDILHLTGVVGIQEPNIHTEVLQVYPNPFTEQSILTISTPENGNAVISIVDVAGRTVYQFRTTISSGTNSYHISGLNPGMYFIKVAGKNFTYSTKLISQCKLLKLAKIEFISSSKNTIANPMKSTAATINMPYTVGDQLLFKGISGIYSTLVPDVPTGSKTITFNFVRCKDDDGSNYATVKIGSQVWMVENLKTTHYRNGDPITNVTDDQQWFNLSTPAYCEYENNSGNSTLYGRIYNFFAVVDNRNIAPEGWHVPTDAEWTILTDYLTLNGYGFEGSGPAIAKSMASHSGWNTFSGAGTVGNDQASNNRSGFTALPGGGRFTSGGFFDIGDACSWWSSTVTGSFSGWMRGINYDGSACGRGYKENVRGLSVRCIQD